VTNLDVRTGWRLRSAANPRAGAPAVDDLVVRLRESAERMVPFSQDKILMRAAASAIEELDTDVRNRAADIARLTAELKVLRPPSGTS
jgi:hypothetical protein